MTDHPRLYVVACCCENVAQIEVNGDQVTIHPPDGEEVYRAERSPMIDDESWTPEQMQVEYQARDKIHKLMMKWVEIEERHVSEVIWGKTAGPAGLSSDKAHSSWIIQCVACGQQLEVTQTNLPRLAYILTAGNWSAIPDGAVPLGVLGRIWA